MHVSVLKRTAKNDLNLGYVFYYVKKVIDNLVPRASVVEAKLEGPDKGWFSHDQIFKNSWKIFLPNYRVLMFCNVM